MSAMHLLLLAVAFVCLSGDVRPLVACSGLICSLQPLLPVLTSGAAVPPLVEEPHCEWYNLTLGCPRVWHPVCGTNGKDYDNDCFLCLDMKRKNIQISIVKRGKCRSSGHLYID